MLQSLMCFSVDLYRYVHYVYYNSFGSGYTGCIRHVKEIHVISLIFAFLFKSILAVYTKNVYQSSMYKQFAPD